MKNKIIITLLLLLVILLIPEIVGCENTYEYGNTPGNSLNGSWVVKKDNWIYFIDMHNKLCKISLDGKKRLNIDRNSSIEKIFIIDKWIYFANVITETGGESGIFRMSLDGKNKKQIADKKCELVYIMNNLLFYNDISSNLNFYRRNLDDGSEIMIEKTQVRDCCAVGDDLFYLAGFNLIKAKIDGTEKINLAKNVLTFAVSDGCVYFIDGKPDHRSIKSMAIDGSNLKVLKNDGIFNQVFVENGWIYYTGRNRLGNEKIPLTRMKIDGTEEKQIFNDSVAKINIIDDWMYFYHYDQQKGGILYKMKQDGTQLQVFDKP